MPTIATIVEGHGEVDAVPILIRRIADHVLPKAEYEAWFLAAADSIAGQHGIDASTTPPDDPESIQGAKEWLGARMPRGQRYRATLHQAALTAIFDLDAARAAPSFDKLWRDVSELLGSD